MVTTNPVVGRLATYPAEALYAKRRALRAAGVEVFDFSVGDPIEPIDPRIVAACQRGVTASCGYPSIAGIAELRAACAAYLVRRFAVTLDADAELLPTRGSKEAIFHLPLTFLDPAGRRRVIYGTPGYPVYERGTLFAGGEPWPVELRPERGYRLEPWELDPQLIAETCAIWINYPHNPTAATVDRSYLERMIAFCHEHEILLCSDECYVDIFFERQPPSVLQLAREGVLAFHSLSKRSGLTGYRSGFIAGDAQLIDKLRATRANFGVAPAVMVQQAAVAAWSDDDHVEQRRQLFRAKRDVLAAFLAERGIAHEPCTATLYLWVRAPDDVDAVSYAEQLAEAGILVSPAPYHGVDQPYVRLALVPSVEDCRRAVAAWQRLLQGRGRR